MLKLSMSMVSQWYYVPLGERIRQSLNLQEKGQ